MNWSSLMSRTSFCNQQPGADQIKTPYFLRGTIPAGTNLPLLSGLVWALSSLNLGYKTITGENIIFLNVVTIFFRPQRNLEKKKYLFKNSCHKEIAPPLTLDQCSLDHVSKSSVMPETNKQTKALIMFFSSCYLWLVSILVLDS